MIAIIDYAMGNPGSIQNMLRYLGYEAEVTADAGRLRRADRLILPGVGAFDQGMLNLHDRGLPQLLEELVVRRHRPLLGVCLGMQLLGLSSEEGKRAGLGWIHAHTRRFSFDPRQTGLKIPHMGWNHAQPVTEDPLFHGFEDVPRFYFVHSYHVVCEQLGDVLATTTHGYPFTAALRHGNIYGTQFHPEKSHRYGMQLLRNFVESCSC